MKSVSKCWLFFLASAAVFLSAGCSGEPEKPGKIEKFTDQAAHKTVEQIRQPIERARQVEGLVNTHSESIEKAVEQMQ